MRVISVFLLCLLPASAMADGFQPVTDKNRFVELIQDKNLKRFGVVLRVSPEGAIDGNAFGYELTGQWRWENGYFCRTMSYGSGDLPDNCQMVLERDDTLRFISDRGQGDRADLRLR